MRLILAATLIWLIAMIITGTGSKPSQTPEPTKTTITYNEPSFTPPAAPKPIPPEILRKASTIKPDELCHSLGNALRNGKPILAEAIILRIGEQNPQDISNLDTDLIKKQQISIGINQCTTLASWGKPERNNRSVGPYGVHEQWVYPADYLYFENGILTSFQNQR